MVSMAFLGEKKHSLIRNQSAGDSTTKHRRKIIYLFIFAR